MKLQKFGGITGIASICAYIVYAIQSSLILPSDIGGDPAKTMTAISAAPGGFYVINLLFAVSSLLGLAMIVALHERMHANTPYLSKMMLIASSTSTVIWITESIINIKSIGIFEPPQDLTAFKAFWAISNGLHFTGGHANGWACLFMGCAILVTRSFSRILGCLLLLLGILWIPTFFLVHLGFRLTIPIIMLLCCVTLIWVGVSMLRQEQSPSVIRNITEEK